SLLWKGNISVISSFAFWTNIYVKGVSLLTNQWLVERDCTGVIGRLILGWAVPTNPMASTGICLVHCPP
ncbi:hypothetical protein, partial [Moorena sp. SIO4G3]|uniref:hypothetical protein n=1 Tax=Moorena sp. SIO4G3 TaxID=2607821 RepID=UPI0025E1EB02